MPVALDVEDRLGRDACERARGEEGDQLVHALHERGLGTEAAQLAGDPEGQEQVEERPVEGARTRGRDEAKPCVAGG